MVSAGAVRDAHRDPHVHVALFSQIAAIPAGSRLQVTFASSTAGTEADPVYSATPPTGSPALTSQRASSASRR